MNHLRAVCEANSTALVLVTHDPEIAIEYAERIIGIRDGRKAFDGSGQSLADLKEFLTEEQADTPQLEK